MRVLVTGGTGFVGRALSRALGARGDEVVALSRRDGSYARLPTLIEDAGAVVNLAGESIASRWTAARKRRLRDSRIGTTRRVVEAIAAARRPPPVLVSASAVGYYGARPDGGVGEDAPPGDDFLARLCVDWEAEATHARPRARVAIARLAVVLGREGGALPRMLPPFRLGLGGPLGDGTQPFPWVHVDDVAGALRLAIDRADLDGPFNVVAPEPATNAEFTRALGAALGRPARLRVPAFGLRLALGEMADTMLLAGQRVVPRRLQALGFPFAHPSLEPALRSLLG